MKNKKNYMLSICVGLFILCGYGYYRINKDIPKAYDIEEYKLGEKVRLDNIEFKIDSFKKYKNTRGDFKLSMNFDIKNISNDNFNCNEIMNSMLEAENLKPTLDYMDYDDIKFKSLKPKEEIKILFEYNFGEKYEFEVLNKEKEFNFYIDPKLYKNQIIEKSKSKIYRKVIRLFLN